jgi:small subunit ribosomal protein S21
VIRVKALANESIDQMLLRFRRLCEREGLIREVRRLAFYEKPSETRQRRRRIVRRKIERESSGG